MPLPSQGTREWRVVQRWPNGDELAIGMGSEGEARRRQAVLDANTSHPSGYQRRIEVVRIESRQVGSWEEADRAAEHVPSMVTLCKGEHPWGRS